MYSISTSAFFPSSTLPYPILHTSICFDTPSRPRADYRKKKQPHLTVITSTKAEPTVSITNTNAISTGGTCLLPSPTELSNIQSYIPFPSSTSIPRHSHGQSGSDENELPRRTGIQRRRASACLSSPCHNLEKPIVHTRSHSASSPVVFVLNLDTLIPAAPPTPVSKPKLPVKRPYVPSPKAIKRARKSRKQNIDLHFIATMHRSIAMCLRNDSRPRSTIVEQEHLLVERLWRNLLGQGCKPILQLDANPSISTPNGLSCEAVRLNPVEMQIEASPIPLRSGLPSPPPSPTSCTPKSAMHRSPEARSASQIELASPIPVLPCSPTFAAPTALPLSPPPTPSLTSEGPLPEILTMPQLVASLILRHNDRKAGRPRSAPKSGDTSKKKVAKPSPLSMTYIDLVDQLQE